MAEPLYLLAPDASRAADYAAEHGLPRHQWRAVLPLYGGERLVCGIWAPSVADLHTADDLDQMSKSGREAYARVHDRLHISGASFADPAAPVAAPRAGVR